MEAVKIALTCVIAAVLYGIVHDQFTARICIEYFTVFHPPIFHTQSPTLLGIGWGVVATWWVGAFFSVPMIIWIDPLRLVECTYNMSTHQLHCMSDDLSQTFDTSHARSGEGLCKNNRARENKHDQGQLPEGEYSMGSIGGTRIRHKVPRVPLTAVDGSITYGRDSFEVHQGNDSSSTGCTVLDPDEYSRFQRFYATNNSGVMGVR